MVTDQINLILFICYICMGLFLSFIYSLQRDSPKIRFRSILLTLISINFQFLTNVIILLIYLFSSFNVSCNWFYWIGHLLIPNLALLQFFKLIRLIYLFWLSHIKLKASRRHTEDGNVQMQEVWWKRDKFTRNWTRIRPWFQSPLLVTQLLVQLGFNSVIIVIIQLAITKFHWNIDIFTTPSSLQVCSTSIQIYITVGELGLFFILSWCMLVVLLLMGIKETYGILIELVASLIILPIHLILCVILMYPGLFQLSDEYIINVVYLNWFLSFFMFLIYLVPFIQPNLNLYKNLESYNKPNHKKSELNSNNQPGNSSNKPKLETILKDPVMFLDFKRFAANHFCVENVLFFERYAKLIQMCNIGTPNNWNPSGSYIGFGIAKSSSKLSSIGGATIIDNSISNLPGGTIGRELSPIHSPHQKELSPRPETINSGDIEVEVEVEKNPITSDEVCIDDGTKPAIKNHLNINIYNDNSDENIIIMTPDGKTHAIPPFLSDKEGEDDDSDILPQFPEFNYHENNSSDCASLATCQKLELKSNNPVIREIHMMYQDFIHPSSPLQLNITATTRKSIQQEISKLEKKLTRTPNFKIDITILEGWSEIYEEVYNTLLLDTFPRYLKFLETITKSWLQQKRA